MDTFELLFICVVASVLAVVIALYYVAAELQLYRSEENIKKAKEHAKDLVWNLHRKGEFTSGQVTVYLILLEMITDEENAERNASILHDLCVKCEQDLKKRPAVIKKTQK